jgi:hypothetical protein
MEHSKLINILKTFSKEEMKQFEKFVSSPFHNSIKNNKKLITELKRFYPGFDNSKLTYEYLFGKIYAGKKFNKQMMWNLISAMEKLAKEFLELIALKQDKFQSRGLLLSELGKRKLLNDYVHSLNEMGKQLETNAIEYNYFENKGHLENFRQEYYHSMDRIQPMADSKLKATEYQIILFLRMTVGGLSDMRTLSYNHNCRFDVNIPLELAKHMDLESVVNYAHSKNFEYAFLVEIYFHALMTILKPDETKHFDRLRELYGIHFNKFTMSEKRAIMHWLVNYCVHGLEFDETKYRRIIFELNEFRLKEALVYYPEEQIPKVIYFQILSTALFVNEIEWSENFIKNYSSKLQPEIRKSLKALAYAMLYFQTKEYDKVLDNLNNVEFFEIVDKLYVRNLIAKTYYELNEIESLLHYIDASLHFLADNPSIPDNDRVSYTNLFNSLKKIVSIKEHSNSGAILPLRKAIEQMKIAGRKQWLIEKLDELEKK